MLNRLCQNRVEVLALPSYFRSHLEIKQNRTPADAMLFPGKGAYGLKQISTSAAAVHADCESVYSVAKPSATGLRIRTNV